MEERHLHFNLVMAFWYAVFIVVLLSAVKFGVNKWRVPGVTELVNYVTGG